MKLVKNEIIIDNFWQNQNCFSWHYQCTIFYNFFSLMMMNWFRNSNNFLIFLHCYFCTYRQSILNDYVKLLTSTSSYKICESKKLNNDNEYSESFLCLIISCKKCYLIIQIMTQEKFLKKNIISKTFKFIKTIFQDILQNTSQITIINIYFETVNMNTISILLQSTTEYV